ncbi:MAG: hypothetical protein LUC32_05735 [Clostridiales bacterium]|nr:hypothetical protein [Clostridiales bacterium]
MGQILNKERFTLDKEALYLWGVLYIVIVVMSVICILLPDQRKYEEKQRKTYDDKKVKESIEAEMPYQKLVGKVEYDSVFDEVQEPVVLPSERTGYKNEQGEFGGAIKGTDEIYLGKVYPLQDKEQVYFVHENEMLYISKVETVGVLASLYYISEYGEYCIMPKDRVCVFLESGQPLGMGRKYYLPRGTRIFLKDRKNMFVLA